MKTLSKKKRRRKQKNQARKIQRQISKRKRHHCLGKRLTPEQKLRRSQQLAERKQLKQERKLLSIERNETEKIKNIEKVISSIFNSAILDQLAKLTGFIKRSGGEITPFSFMYIVSFGFLGNGHIALNYLVAGLRNHFNVNVSAQGLSKRINSASSVKFLKKILQKLLAVQLKIGLKNSFSEQFEMFKGIYLQDSTQISLNEALSKDFKGQGGGGSTSALKLDFIYDIANLLVYGIKITDATTNDQTHAKEVLKYIKPGVLILRDLGYFTISVLQKIQEKKAYFLSRLSISTNVYLNPEDEEPIDVPKFLKKLHEEGKDSVNLKVYLGKIERFETRLVAEKVPLHVSKQRSARFKKDRKKEPSSSYVEWCNFSIFVTNIPETMFSGKMIIALYKIRWQIELLFKNFKSNIEINILKGTNKNRIESLLYGKLITIVVMFVIQNYAANIAKGKEISGDKLLKLLKSDNQLRQAIIENNLSMLLIVLECDIELAYKQKRNRKTSYECIKEALSRERKMEVNIMALNIDVEWKKEENELLKVV
jgi:hypothetical protein